MAGDSLHIQKTSNFPISIDIFKIAIVAIVIAGSVYYFNMAFLPENFIKIAHFSTLAIIFVVILFQEIYWKNPLERHHFTLPIVFILIGVFLSMITAYADHDQSFLISLWAQRFMYFYLFYFALHVIRLDANTIEKILFTTGIIYALAFLIQYFAFPRVLFNVRLGLERGTIRIFIPGLTFLYLAYFRSLTRVIYDNSLRQLPYLFLFLVIFILSGTRSIIAGPAIVTFGILIFSNRIKSKALIMVLIIAMLTASYYMFEEIIQNLLSLSQEQTNRANQDIRIRAAKFFLTDFFPDNIAYITGNGEGHQASNFGLKILSYKLNYGYYQSDIGFLGEYIKFGVFLILGAAVLFYRGIFQRLNSKYLYIRYFLILLLISTPLGMFFTTSHSITTLCLVMYLIDKQKNNQKKKKKHPIVYFPELEQSSQQVLITKH